MRPAVFSTAQIARELRREVEVRENVGNEAITVRVGQRIGELERGKGVGDEGHLLGQRSDGAVLAGVAVDVEAFDGE